ncbi:MAG: hypothetical protein IPG76_18475 [Acidobacteria bacterium]|nr:hypothetical protein [Acidobacteriota bacterium]
MPGKKDRYYRIRNGKIYARVTFTDAAGRRRDVDETGREQDSRPRTLDADVHRVPESRLVYYRCQPNDIQRARGKVRRRAGCSLRSTRATHESAG